MNRRHDFSDTVVIVLGPSFNSFVVNHHVPFWISNVLQNGGAVLVAHDSPVQVQLGVPLPPLQIGARRVVTREPNVGQWLVLGGNEVAQFAVPTAPPVGRDGPEWKLFGGEQPLHRVVTEEPGSLTGLRNSALPILAGFPPNAEFKGGGGRVSFSGDGLAAGTAAVNPATGRSYRFLAVADHAVFLNRQMVEQDENGPTDNLEFGARVVSFLSEEGGRKQRTKCLLVVKGNVVRDYDELNRLLRPPMPPLPKIDWGKLQPKLVDLGNQILDKVQENDIPNKMMVGSNPDAPRSLLRIMLGLLLTGAALWALVSLVRRVWGARQPTDLNAAPPGGRPPPPPDGAAGVFGRRGKELAGRDNLLEPARAACRDFFDTVGRPPDPGPRLPKVVISDVVKKPDTLRQALRDIWGVAYGRPSPVTAMRWVALEPLIGRALAAHREGKWRFVEADAWPDVSTRPRGEA